MIQNADQHQKRIACCQRDIPPSTKAKNNLLGKDGKRSKNRLQVSQMRIKRIGPTQNYGIHLTTDKTD